MVNRRDGDRFKHQKLSKRGSGDRLLSSSSEIAKYPLVFTNDKYWCTGLGLILLLDAN
ncbi:MAG: hypothetical protein IM542_07260 [Pseudanabaena sp. M165S2SP1A06QC]|nr:hypothetical protein [Pseudanabaena sp. M165S2SP1A06QC]